MRTYIIPIFTICAMLMACQKETIEPVEPKPTTLKQDLTPDVITKGSKGRHIIIITNHTTGEITHVECYGYGGGCGPAVSVSAIAFNPVLDVIDSKNKTAISEIFSINQNQLNSVFGSQNVTLVIQGSLTVKNLGQYLQDSGKTLTYIQLCNTSNEAVSSYPIHVQ